MLQYLTQRFNRIVGYMALITYILQTVRINASVGVELDASVSVELNASVGVELNASVSYPTLQVDLHAINVINYHDPFPIFMLLKYMFFSYF